jgi:hypothetical protein
MVLTKELLHLSNPSCNEDIPLTMYRAQRRTSYAWVYCNRRHPGSPGKSFPPALHSHHTLLHVTLSDASYTATTRSSTTLR